MPEGFSFIIGALVARCVTVASSWLEIFKMYDWVPVAFATFKGVIFVTCMYLAIKWHYDQGKKKGIAPRALLLTSAKLVAGFLLAVIAVMGLTLFFAQRMGMDLGLAVV